MDLCQNTSSMKKIRPVLPLLTSVLFIVSCSKSGSDPDTPPATSCTGAAKTFSLDVNPIIQTYCNQASCHASGSTNGPGPLTNYSQVYSARAVIRNAVATGLMPKNTTLSTAQKNAVVCWIDSGAPNN